VLQLGQRIIAERLLHLDGLAGLEELVDVGRHQERNDIVLPMRVRSAVIPAAGLGTRFLPASKAVPKEMFPIGHRPALQIVVDEALGAGCDHVVIVSSASKPAIERYFRRDEELIARLRDQGDDMLADQLDAVNRDWRATIVYQDRPRGLGHAVGCARDAVGDQPFAVLLPDALMGSAGVLAQMNGVCAATGGSVVAVVNVPREQVVDYGVVEPSGPQTPDGVIPIRGLVEKPSVEDGRPRRCSTTTSTAGCAPATVVELAQEYGYEGPADDRRRRARHLVQPWGQAQRPRALPRDVRPHRRRDAGPRRDRTGRLRVRPGPRRRQRRLRRGPLRSRAQHREGLTLDEVVEAVLAGFRRVGRHRPHDLRDRRRRCALRRAASRSPSWPCATATTASSASTSPAPRRATRRRGTSTPSST
jgi:UTP-glucose-1-phosphate uridylyltransferase